MNKNRAVQIISSKKKQGLKRTGFKALLQVFVCFVHFVLFLCEKYLFLPAVEIVMSNYKTAVIQYMTSIE